MSHYLGNPGSHHPRPGAQYDTTPRHREGCGWSSAPGRQDRIDPARVGCLDHDVTATADDRYGSDDLDGMDLPSSASTCGEGEGRAAALLPPLLLRLLPGGANQFPGGIYTHCGPAPFMAHSNCRFAGMLLPFTRSQTGRNWVNERLCNRPQLATHLSNADRLHQSPHGRPRETEVGNAVCLSTSTEDQAQP